MATIYLGSYLHQLGQGIQSPMTLEFGEFNLKKKVFKLLDAINVNNTHL